MPLATETAKQSIANANAKNHIYKCVIDTTLSHCFNSAKILLFSYMHNIFGCNTLF